MTPLEKFGRWCLTEIRGDGIDDGAAQEKAIALGLLGYVDVAEPCGDECHCAEYHGQFPVECLRETPLAKGDEKCQQIVSIIGNKEEKVMTTTVSSTSDERTANNVMRHQYRVLSDREKEQMQAIKDKGLELYRLFESIGQSRELSLAKTKVEEAVMWAVKHITL